MRRVWEPAMLERHLSNYCMKAWHPSYFKRMVRVWTMNWFLSLRPHPIDSNVYQYLAQFIFLNEVPQWHLLSNRHSTQHPLAMITSVGCNERTKRIKMNLIAATPKKMTTVAVRMNPRNCCEPLILSCCNLPTIALIRWRTFEQLFKSDLYVHTKSTNA